MNHRLIPMIAVLALALATVVSAAKSAGCGSQAKLLLRSAVVVSAVPFSDETGLTLNAGGVLHEVVCLRNLRALCAALEPGDTVNVVAAFPPSDADDQRFVLSHLSVLLAPLAEPPLPPGDGDVP